jgi:ABC-2 type transport system ATP-binding protein
MTTFALRADDLVKRYGGTTALHGIDLGVAAGCVFGLIGPNGAGKTTTMRCMLDIIRPTSGTLSVLGTDPTIGGAPLRRRIGYLPGDLRLDARISGRTLLEHYARMSGAVGRGEIDRLAARLDLDLSRRIRTLSKGNRQKLGIVQAFMHRPELLVLDEPTSGLDPLMQRQFLDLVNEAKDAGQTVILSSHVLSEIQQCADQVAILRRGRIVTVSDVDTIRAGAQRRIRAVVAGTTAGDVRARLAAAAIDGLDVGDDLTITGELAGDIDPFIKAIAPFTVVDLLVEEPDLEQAVLSMYETESTDAH